MGECFFWYRPTRVVPDRGPLNSCVCLCVYQLDSCLFYAMKVVTVERLWTVVFVAGRVQAVLPVTQLAVFCDSW